MRNCIQKYNPFSMKTCICLSYMNKSPASHLRCGACRYLVAEFEGESTAGVGGFGLRQIDTDLRSYIGNGHGL